MIAIVNPNVGLDYILFFKNFQKNSTLRALQAKWGLGGKGLVVAYILANLGLPVWLTGFSGGRVGKVVEDDLRAKKMEVDFVKVCGEVRINVVLIDQDQNWQSTVIAPGVKVNPGDEKILISKVQQRLSKISCLVLGGSLPTGCSVELYCELIKLVKKKGIPCILDASGAPLREALKAGPTAIKPNQFEAEDLLGKEILDREGAFEAAKELGQMGIPWVVITLGSKGLVACDGKSLLYAPAPPVVPKNTAGAGDAITAGIALGLYKGMDLQESLRWGLALAAVLMNEETVLECNFSRANGWYEKTEIITIAERLTDL